MSTPVIQFWFEFASTYSYPAAMRIEAAAKARGVVVEWRPFLLGPVFASQGWQDSPFNIYPTKGKYMVRDLERTCAALDLGSRQELRKLLDLLAIGPLRYSLTGVGAWNEAGIDKMQVFLARWRGSRFATLNAGGNVLVKLTSSSFYVLPESWPSTGYPGPLEYVFNAINS